MLNIRFLKVLLIITGSWRLPLTDIVLHKTAYYLYSFIYQLLLHLLFISFLINIPISLISKDFKKFNDVIMYTITMSLILAKNFIYQSKKMQKLILQCEIDQVSFFKGRAVVAVAERHAKILHRILSFLIIVTLCSTSSVMFHGLSNYLEYRNTNLTSNITLMLPIWYPFNESKHLGLAFTLDLCLLTIGTLTNFTTQALFLTLTTHVAFQLKSLQIFAEDLELCYETTTIPHQIGEENNILASLKWLYRRHYRVIEFVKQINTSIRTILIMDFCLYSVNISAAIVGLFIIETSFLKNVNFGFHCLLHLLQLFLMSWHSNEIRIQSTAFSDALYRSKWYEYPKSCKKIILMMMMRSAKPLELYIGFLFPLTNQTALITIRAAYSYITLVFSLATKSH